MASFRRRGKKWQVSLCIGGIRDSQTFEAKAKAHNWAVARVKNLTDGISTTHTLGDVFGKYAKEVSPSKKGVRWEVVRLEKLGCDKIAEIKLIDLKTEHLQEWVDRRVTEVLPSSANREMN